MNPVELPIPENLYVLTIMIITKIVPVIQVAAVRYPIQEYYLVFVIITELILIVILLVDLLPVIPAIIPAYILRIISENVSL